MQEQPELAIREDDYELDLSAEELVFEYDSQVTENRHRCLRSSALVLLILIGLCGTVYFYRESPSSFQWRARKEGSTSAIDSHKNQHKDGRELSNELSSYLFLLPSITDLKLRAWLDPTRDHASLASPGSNGYTPASYPDYQAKEARHWLYTIHNTSGTDISGKHRDDSDTLRILEAQREAPAATLLPSINLTDPFSSCSHHGHCTSSSNIDSGSYLSNDRCLCECDPGWTGYACMFESAVVEQALSSRSFVIPGTDGRVVLATVTSHNHDHWFNNFLYHLDRLNMSRHLVAVGIGSDHGCTHANKRGVVCIPTDALQEYLDVEDSSHPLSERQWHRACNIKAIFVQHALSLGYHVIFSDADIAWLRSPIFIARTDVDIAISSDSLSATEEGYEKAEWNTGIVWYRHTQQTLDLATLTVDRLNEVTLTDPTRPGSLTTYDQRALNQVVNEMSVTTRPSLHTLDVLNYTQQAVHHWLRLPQQQNIVSSAVHSAFSYSSAAKIYRMQEELLWRGGYVRNAAYFQDQLLVFDYASLSLTETVTALRNALFIAHLTKYRVILPLWNLREHPASHFFWYQWGTTDMVLNIDALREYAPGLWLPHSHLLEPWVPPSYLSPVHVTFNNASSDGSRVLLHSSDGKNGHVTVTDIVHWFDSLSQAGAGCVYLDTSLAELWPTREAFQAVAGTDRKLRAVVSMLMLATEFDYPPDNPNWMYT